MGNFKIIENENQIKLGRSWTDSGEFNAKNKIGEKSGRQYRLIGKERNLSCVEIGLRKMIGIVLIIISFSGLKKAKFVDKLLHAKKAKKRFGIIKQNNMPLQSPIGPNGVKLQSGLGQAGIEHSQEEFRRQIEQEREKIQAEFETELKNQKAEMQRQLEQSRAEYQSNRVITLAESDRNVAEFDRNAANRQAEMQLLMEQAERNSAIQKQIMVEKRRAEIVTKYTESRRKERQAKREQINSEKVINAERKSRQVNLDQ